MTKRSVDTPIVFAADAPAATISDRVRRGTDPVGDLGLNPLPDLRDGAPGRARHGVGEQYAPFRNSGHLRDPGPIVPAPTTPDRPSHELLLNAGDPRREGRGECD